MSKGSWREFDNPSLSERGSGSLGKSELINDRQVRVQRTRAGKKGKTVTMIYGLLLTDLELRKLLKSLKAKCGTGGTLKQDCLELQGDQVDSVLVFLKNQGFNPKQSGS